MKGSGQALLGRVTASALGVLRLGPNVNAVNKGANAKDSHAWHFLHAKLQIQNESIFLQLCRIFWNLVTNLILEKFPKFIEIILVRVFLHGDLRAIGRLRVSRGSK